MMISNGGKFMKYFIKVFLLPCLLFIFASCALLPKGKGRLKTARRPTVIAETSTSRRHLSEPGEEEKEIDNGRRTFPKPGIEKVSKEKKTDAKEKLALDKSVSIFEPFDPDKETPGELLEETEGDIPEEIKKELLGEAAPEEDFVTLNFEQAPIEEILNAISETIGINFIMTPGVKGAITMQTSKPVPATELFQILQSVLEVNGLTLVPSGRYYKVVWGKEAKQYPIKVMSGKEGEELPFEDSFITQIIPLDFIPVKDMVSILQPFLSKSAPPMIQHEELNILIVNDLASNMKRLLRFVQELDKPIYQPKEKVYVYYVENGDAEKLANTLNSIYKSKEKSKFPFAQTARERQEAQQQQPEPQQVIQTPFGPYFPSEEVSGEVRITADKEINALIIVTAPRDYPAVLETIKKLDIMPKQALIEAMIVDVILSDRTEFGLGWFLKGKTQSLGSNTSELDLSVRKTATQDDFNKFVASLTGIDAENYSTTELWDQYRSVIEAAGVMDPSSIKDIFGYKLITDSQHFVAFMKMLSEMTTLNVISSPYIMAMDNQKATIHITHDHPIPKWQEIGTTTTGIRNFERTFDYKEVGLKLDVTPKINESNLVTLELQQEVSEVSEITEDGGVVVNKRSANSSVVVEDGQTIIIGGLIQKTKNKAKSGIPFLSDIPVVGRLFGGSSDSFQRTELLIFITPHVISTQDEVKRITTDFENKVDRIKELITEAGKGLEE